MPDASSARPAKRVRRERTTASQEQSEDPHSPDEFAAPVAERFVPTHAPNRSIPPIGPTPPTACPLPNARASLVSRRYDLEAGQPLYRVRIERLAAPPSNAETAGSAADRTNDNGNAAAEGKHNGDRVDGEAHRAEQEPEELDVCLDDILDYVSPAELERFELEYEDDMVVMVGEDGEVLLVSREAQQALMAGAGAAPSSPARDAEVEAAARAVGVVPPKRRGHPPKKAPKQAFVDLLPSTKRRGRPPKKHTAAVMGTIEDAAGLTVGEEEEPDTGVDTGADIETDTDLEGVDYGAEVDPASVRGTGDMSGAAREQQDNSAAPSEAAIYEDAGGEEPGELSLFPAGVEGISKERASRRTSPARGGVAAARRSARSATSSGASTRAASHARADERSGRGRQQRHALSHRPAQRTTTAASPAPPVRASRTASGARLRRSSTSSAARPGTSSSTGAGRELLHSAASQRRSTRSSAASSRAGSEAAVNGTRRRRTAASASRHSSTPDPDPTPRAAHRGSSPNRQRKPDHQPANRRAASPSPAAGLSTWFPEDAATAAGTDDEGEEEDEYEIEAVLAHKRFAGDVYFLVQWAGWPPAPKDEQSWFTAEDLEGARDVLDEYLEGLRERRNGESRGRGKGKGKESAIEVDEDGDGREGDVDMLG